MDTRSTNQNKSSLKKRRLKRVWRQIRPAAVTLLSVVIVYLIAMSLVNYFVSNYIRPVDVNDATPIEVTVPPSASASSIARLLYAACGPDEPGLITNTAVFKVYVDFVGKANTMKAGTYVLSKNMSIKQIVDVICEGNPPKATVKFTIPEGFTIPSIAKSLAEKGAVQDEQAFLAACTNGGSYENFAFIKAVITGDKASYRAYPLEGYLFPDTYEVYADASVDTILIKMLNRFNEIFTDADKARAAELNMSVDDVVVLASLIEREAQVDTDFAKVSAVFHNRMKQSIALQSCASLSYVLGVNKYTFTEEELQADSPYNTYKFSGLPAGPVCCPGRTAIEAALYPSEEYMNEGYLFFCNGNPSMSRELLFSRTYEEHQKNVEENQQYWG